MESDRQLMNSVDGSIPPAVANGSQSDAPQDETGKHVSVKPSNVFHRLATGPGKRLCDSTGEEQERFWAEMNANTEGLLRHWKVDVPNWLESHGVTRDLTLATQIAIAELGEYIHPEELDDIGLDRLEELFRFYIAKKQTEIGIARIASAEHAPPAVPSSGAKPVDENEARHSSDFASVYWFGEPYVFTTNEANCIRVLWEAWENKTPVMGCVAIMDAAGVNRDDERLDLVFRNNRAWGSMIVSPSKGRYCLKSPDAAT